jgi:hypothetical protein
MPQVALILCRRHSRELAKFTGEMRLINESAFLRELRPVDASRALGEIVQMAKT